MYVGRPMPFTVQPALAVDSPLKQTSTSGGAIDTELSALPNQ